jgi:hypothetical protein
VWLQAMMAKLTGRRSVQGEMPDKRSGWRSKEDLLFTHKLDTPAQGPRCAPAPAAALLASRALFRRGSPLPARTGPLELLHGRHVLVLCDVDNLSLGARDLGYKVSYGRLAELLHRSSQSCRLHAFFPGSWGDLRRIEYFRARGWTAHVKEIEIVQTHQGQMRLTNSDSLILLWAGWLAGQSLADLVVLATGDGSLVCETARFLGGCSPFRQVVTLSLVGSTSCRVDANRNPYVWANLALGKDALRPASPSLRDHGEATAAGLRQRGGATGNGSNGAAGPIGTGRLGGSRGNGPRSRAGTRKDSIAANGSLLHFQ